MSTYAVRFDTYTAMMSVVFFKPMTEYGMRSSHWSSDVCSSDLQVLALWLADARVDQVGSAAVLAEGVGFGTGDIAAVAAVQLLDLAIVRGKQDVPAAERLAPHRAGAIFLAAAVERDRGVEIEIGRAHV